jgi:hypothetical protein
LKIVRDGGAIRVIQDKVLDVNYELKGWLLIPCK